MKWNSLDIRLIIDYPDVDIYRRDVVKDTLPYYNKNEDLSQGDTALTEYDGIHESTLSFPFSGPEKNENYLINGKYIIAINIY